MNTANNAAMIEEYTRMVQESQEHFIKHKAHTRFRKSVEGAMLFMYIGNELELHRVENGQIAQKTNPSIAELALEFMTGGWVAF